MKCVIVTAGASTRLRPLTDKLPKCLLTVGGKTILQRTLESILEAKVDTTALVVGFEAGQIRAHVRECFPGKQFPFILNPHYQSTNNAYSLLLAREFFLKTRPGVQVRDGLLVLDSDVVFNPSIIKTVIGRGDVDRIALRVSGHHDAEEILVKTDDNGNVVKIGKGLALRDAFGESIGIEYFTHDTMRSLFDILLERVRGGKGRTEFYEAAFQELVDRGVRIKAEDIGDKMAFEIDTVADLKLARERIESFESRSDV